MAYEKKMHQDQAMRSMQLSQQPNTPNMAATDVASPLQQGPASGASPRNPSTARQMQRDTSKGGAMLPPRSPATSIQRTITPKPGTSGKTPGATPKMIKDENLVSRVSSSVRIATDLSIKAGGTNSEESRPFSDQRYHPNGRRLELLVIPRPHPISAHPDGSDQPDPGTSLRPVPLGRFKLAQLCDEYRLGYRWRVQPRRLVRRV